MSNVKSVGIVGEVPFNWLEEVPQTDRALLASVFLHPTTGLHLVFRENLSHFEENEHGGRTLIVPFQIYGREAVGEVLIRRLVEIFQTAGTVTYATFLDIENGVGYKGLIDLLKEGLS